MARFRGAGVGGLRGDRRQRERKHTCWQKSGSIGEDRGQSGHRWRCSSGNLSLGLGKLCVARQVKCNVSMPRVGGREAGASRRIQRLLPALCSPRFDGQAPGPRPPDPQLPEGCAGARCGTHGAGASFTATARRKRAPGPPGRYQSWVGTAMPSWRGPCQIRWPGNSGVGAQMGAREWAEPWLAQGRKSLGKRSLRKSGAQQRGGEGSKVAGPP
jgi:hypothetical protein